MASCKRCHEPAPLSTVPGDGWMFCECCDNITHNCELVRSNPPPFGELIVCEDCYDFACWRYLDLDDPDVIEWKTWPSGQTVAFRKRVEVD